jgi:hypothetical protein
MTNPAILSTIKIGGASIEIQLIESQKAASVVIHWPTQNTSISASRFPDVAAGVTRAFSSASIELSRRKLQGRRPTLDP